MRGHMFNKHEGIVITHINDKPIPLRLTPGF
jgi:hypothetical protein